MLSPTTTNASNRRAFTLTELLVAIGIIAILIAILLPALSKVIGKAKRTQTESTLQEFAKACDAFQQEFGFYPGIVPEAVLAADPKISGMENALLHLMGGAIDQDDPQYASFGGAWSEITFGSGPNAFSIKVNKNEIGKGPRMAGKQFPPFFAPKSSELQAAEQVYSGSDYPFSMELPDLLDAWGQPVAYFRAMRDSGPLVGAANVGQYSAAPLAPYVTNVTALGELGKSQAQSLFNVTNDVPRTLAQILRSVAFKGGASAATDDPLNGTARGRYAIISPGPDGIYFASTEVLGGGSNPTPVLNIFDNVANPAGPTIVNEYDDIRIFGGG